MEVATPVEEEEVTPEEEVEQEVEQVQGEVALAPEEAALEEAPSYWEPNPEASQEIDWMLTAS